MDASKFDLLKGLVLSLVCFISTLLGFQSDALAPAVVDVRSVGMGNTASLSAVGSNAIFYNPALLGNAQWAEIQIGGRTYWGDAYDESAAGGDFRSQYFSVPVLTHISALIPIHLQSNQGFETVIVPAIGYHRHLDLSRKQEISYEDELGYYQIEETVKGGFSTIAPALALQYDNKLGIGIAYHFGGVIGVKWKYLEQGLYDSREYDTTGGYYQSWGLRINGDYSSEGSFVQVGGYAEPIPQITLAFSYRSPIKWGWRYGEEYVHLSLIEWDHYEGWDTLSLSDEFEYDNDEAYGLPGIITLGLGAQPFPFLVLAGEYQTRSFSNQRVVDEYIGVDNGSVFRFGAEFISPVIIRAGFYYDAIPLSDEGESTPKSLTGFTTGVGIPLFSVLVINGCFEYATWNMTINDEGARYVEDLLRVGASIKVRFPVK